MTSHGNNTHIDPFVPQDQQDKEFVPWQLTETLFRPGDNQILQKRHSLHRYLESECG